MTQQANQPVKEFRAGNTKAAIWRNQVEQDGRTVVRFSVKVQKSYRDPQSGSWVNQDMSLFPNELARLRLVLDEAERYCLLRGSDEEAGAAAQAATGPADAS